MEDVHLKKVIDMRIILTILSALFFAPVSTMAGDPLEVQLKELTPADEIQRLSVQIPVMCFLDENNSNITLLSKTSVACDVVIVNESLEEMSTYPCVISEVPTTIPLDSTGEYHISITLVNGTCYYGVFLIP